MSARQRRAPDIQVEIDSSDSENGGGIRGLEEYLGRIKGREEGRRNIVRRSSRFAVLGPPSPKRRKIVHLLDDDSEEDQKQEDTDRLSWRLDPEESLSDWILNVVPQDPENSTAPSTASSSKDKGEEEDDEEEEDSKLPAVEVEKEDQEETAASSSANNGAAIDVYHVHRATMAVGIRKSGYLSALLRRWSSSSGDEDDNSTRLELPEIGRKVFPLFLDYVYHGDESSNADEERREDNQFLLTTETAQALHFLAKYLDVPPLVRLTKSFIKKDLNLTTYSEYYKQARTVGDEYTIQHVAVLCCKEIAKICAVETEPCLAFLLDLFEHCPDELRNEESHKFSQHMSKMVANYCRNNEFDLETFQSLTTEDKLSGIDGSVALELMDFEQKALLRPAAAAAPPTDAEARSPVASDDDLTNLQNRCIVALCSDDWHTVDLCSPASRQLMQAQSPAVLALVLSNLSQNAKECNTKLIKCQAELDELKKENGRRSPGLRFVSRPEERPWGFAASRAVVGFARAERDRAREAAAATHRAAETATAARHRVRMLARARSADEDDTERRIQRSRALARAERDRVREDHIRSLAVARAGGVLRGINVRRAPARRAAGRDSDVEEADI